MNQTLPAIFVETALLGQGLPSVSNQEIKDAWNAAFLARDYTVTMADEEFPGIPEPESSLVWMEEGQIIQGDIERFLEIRLNIGMRRIDGVQLENARQNRLSGFLTASAVMHLGADAGAITVTAGMGGIRENHKSDDLFCLTELPVLLVASAPKDILDLTATVRYLLDHGTSVKGWTSCSDGFLFNQMPVEIPNLTIVPDRDKLPGGILILNPIPVPERLQDRQMLRQAFIAGLEAEKKGESLHPAVNAALDCLSKGVSSQMQLRALVDNLYLAKIISQMLCSKGSKI